MTRAECEAALQPYIYVLDDRSAVISRADAHKLIGPERFRALSNDKIRNLPRNAGTHFYFWNVLDYCCWPLHIPFKHTDDYRFHDG